MFNMFDINHDGNISIIELKQMFCRKQIGFNETDSLIRDIMNEVDKNHDNLISFDEFNNALTDLL